MPSFIGIDTSCYTTSVAAINESSEVISLRTMLQVPPGMKGLRQSDAVFQHIKNLPPLFSEVFNRVKDAVAVCASVAPRPQAESYMPVFVASHSFAQTISASLGIPLFESTHQEGHIAAALLGQTDVPERFLALHVSGGTTEILLVTAEKQGYGISLLGGTLDISAGQLIDRTGVLLGCAFPCGAEMEGFCAPFSDIAIPIYVKDMDCSFSGIENRIRLLIQKGLDKSLAAYLVFSAIALTLAEMIQNAFKQTGLKSIVLSGGVIQNSIIRAILESQLGLENGGLQLYFSPREYAGDNAAGLAYLCRLKYFNGGE